MPLFGLEFILLFIFCILLLLLLLLPTMILLLFPRTLLKYKLVTKYFKPFMDAYQAPFKDTCYNTLGVELLLRGIIYGCETLKADYTGLVFSLISVLYLGYLSLKQPFKNFFNTLIYTMYICNLGCMAVLFIFYPISKPKMYTIAFNCLIGMGFLVFLGIILLHIVKYCMCRSVSVILTQGLNKCKNIFPSIYVSNVATYEMDAASYEQYREHLLALNSNN